ncbi:MAG: hypothetical protein HEQ39_02500 [Rhizobacter sp.]
MMNRHNGFSKIGKNVLLSGVLALGCSLPSVADGPSSYEGAGFVDATIDVCTKSFPAKKKYYRDATLKSFSCGRPLAEMEKQLTDIRQHADPRVVAEYRKGYDPAAKQFAEIPKSDLPKFCEMVIQSKC